MDVGLSSFLSYAQSAVVIKGVGEFVAGKFYLLRRTDGAVACSVMCDDYQAVFAFVQVEVSCAKSMGVLRLVDVLQLFFHIEYGK